MNREKFNPPIASSNSDLKVEQYDSGYKIRGEVFYTLLDEVSGLKTQGHIKNIVVLDAGILIARLMKSTPVANVSEPKFGVYALAVGTGDVGWDPMNPPAANVFQRSLYNEIARKAYSSSSFINSSGGVSAFPTNVVDFNVTFTAGEAVGPLTEMGLLGGDINTNMAIQNPILPPNGPYDPTVNVIGYDTLCNYITFPVINKPPGSSLSFTWRLTF
jgi:hypothetical protein